MISKIVSKLNKKQTIPKNYKIVCIGGGTGLFSLLSGLKEYASNTSQITTIVTTLDSGGSTGKLITQYGMIPPGDLRSCMVALSESSEILAKLFQYRFDEYLDNHNFGNLLIKALEDITGNFEEAIEEASKILQIKGKVIPVSLTQNTLIAECESGEILHGEGKIDTTPDKKIKRLYLEKSGNSNKSAIQAIENADLIIFGPADLYTSILPNILFNRVKKAIQDSSAKKLGILPIMTKKGETDNFTVSLWVKEIEKYLGVQLDILLANSHLPHVNMLKKYEKEEKFPIPIDKENLIQYELIIGNFIDEKLVLRHDSKKLSQKIMELL